MYKLIGTNSVKRLVDGAYIPFADGNTAYEEYKQWLDEGNVPEPEFTAEEIEAEKETQRILLIKSKAKELIEKEYPMYKQNNILMSGINVDIKAMNVYISNIRNISNEAEINKTLFDDIVCK